MNPLILSASSNVLTTLRNLNTGLSGDPSGGGGGGGVAGI